MIGSMFLARFFERCVLEAHFGLPILVDDDIPAVREIMWRSYGEYLTRLKGESYRDTVFSYIEKEDTPRSLEYQLKLLERIGFGQTVVLHKNGPFAAFGAVKAQ